MYLCWATLTDAFGNNAVKLGITNGRLLAVATESFCWSAVSHRIHRLFLQPERLFTRFPCWWKVFIVGGCGLTCLRVRRSILLMFSLSVFFCLFIFCLFIFCLVLILSLHLEKDAKKAFQLTVTSRRSNIKNAKVWRRRRGGLCPEPSGIPDLRWRTQTWQGAWDYTLTQVTGFRTTTEEAFTLLSFLHLHSRYRKWTLITTLHSSPRMDFCLACLSQ